MRVYGRASIHEITGDLIVYRSLEPADQRLPGLDAYRNQIDLPSGIPRKSEPQYARAIVHLLTAARHLQLPKTRIDRLIFVGDTRMNDGQAFANICAAGGWPGLAFIGSENDAPADVRIEPVGQEQVLYLSNRWAELTGFDGYRREQGIPVDEKTAVILDLDKTALGARGRNDHVINRARLQAVRDTVAGLLGTDFDPAGFELAYQQLNQVEFHAFTTDNQDYVAYICLMLGSGLVDPDRFLSDVRTKRVRTFVEFIAAMQSRSHQLPAGLAEIHRMVLANVEAGDPTPFKTFRRNEYRTTLSLMGQLPDDSPAETLLDQEILITQEVRSLALAWREQGALVFALSDKPDEASIPNSSQEQRGYLPIHRVETHALAAG